MPQKPSDEIAFSSDEIEFSPTDVSFSPDEIEFDASDIAPSRPAPIHAQGFTDPASVKVTGGEPYVGNTFRGPGLPNVNPKTGRPVQPLEYGKGIADLPVREGIVQAVQGGKVLIPAIMGLSDPGDQAVYGSANDLLEGIFKASTPLLAAGAIGAPVETALGVIKATVAAKAGSKVAEMVGATPEAQRLAGNLAAATSAGVSVSKFVEKNLNDIHALAEQVRAANAQYDAMNPPEPALKVVTPEGPKRGIRTNAPQLRAVNPEPPPVAIEPVAPEPPPAPIVPIETVWSDLKGAASRGDIPAARTAMAELNRRGIPQQAIQAELESIPAEPEPVAESPAVEPQAEVAFAPEEVQEVVQEPTRTTFKEPEPAPFEPEVPREAALPEKVREPEPGPEPEPVAETAPERPPTPPVAQEREEDVQRKVYPAFTDGKVSTTITHDKYGWTVRTYVGKQLVGEGSGGEDLESSMPYAKKSHDYAVSTENYRATVPERLGGTKKERPEEATLMGVSVGLKDRQEIGGVRYELWRNSQTGEGVMRIMDPESGETVSMSKGPYPTISAKLYGEVQKAERMEREPEGERNAVQEPSPARLDAREQAGNSEAVGQGDTEGGEVAPAREEVPAVQEAIEAARAEVDTEPTEAQKEAGNYKKGHVTVHGLDIAIENPEGSTRSGKSKSGEEWSVTMPVDYGYIKRTEGADGDHVDVFLGPNASDPQAPVYVIDQTDLDTNKFDEHKVVIGARSLNEAKAYYARSFSDSRGYDRIGHIEKMSLEEFKGWLKGDTSKPVAVADTKAPTVAINPERGSVEVSFPEKPDRAVLDKLKAAGFRWAKTNKVWYRKATNAENVAAQARKIVGIEGPKPGEPIPAMQEFFGGKKTELSEPARPKWTEIGTNERGYTIYENADGIRSYVDANGDRNIEPVRLIPTRGGIKKEPSRTSEYQVVSKAEEPVTLEVKSLQTGRSEEVRLPPATRLKDEAPKAQFSVGDLVAYWAPSLGVELAGRITGFTNEGDAYIGDRADEYTRPVGDLRLIESKKEAPAAKRRQPKQNILALLKAGDVDALSQEQVDIIEAALTDALEKEGVSGYASLGYLAANGWDNWLESMHVFDEGSIAQVLKNAQYHLSRATRKEEADGTTDDAGELPASAGRTPGRRGAGSKAALGAVPAENVREPETAGGVVARHGSESRVLADRVRDDAADVSEQPDVTLGGGGDHPSPVAVSPTGATHDPGHPALDFDLTPERIEAIVSRGNVTRAKDNLAAIDLVKKLKAEDRYATAAEQETLAKYVGWGASDIAPFLESYPRPGWSKNERAIWERIQALPEDERKAMGRSRLNAHFTFDLYRPIWDALVRAGFNGGRVLEPAVGTGHAFGLMPPDVRVASTLSASELEPLTAAIAGYLYPSATVQAVGYEKAMIARGTQDLVISNVPFGDYGIDDPLMPKDVTSRIHNYFFAKAMEHVRPGGLVVFVTSRYTMDNVKFAGVRSYLMDRADFIGAVRLPNTAFDKTAKTEVVTDLIVLRRREDGQEPSKQNDLFLRSVEHPSLTGRRGQRPYRSSWYTEHPEYILGEEAIEGSMYSDSEYTVTATSKDVLAALSQELEHILTPGTYQRAARVKPKPQMVERGTYKAGEYRIGEKGKVEIVTSDGEAYDATPMRNGKPDLAAAKRIAGMVQVRDALRETVAVMGRRDATDAEIAKAQKALTKRYDAFVKEYGELNSPLNKRLFSSDPESTNLLALERLEAKALETERKDGTKILTVKYQVVGRSDIFTKRTINPPVEKTSVDTPKDALLASLGQFASIDWNYMAKLSGTPIKELRASLEAEGLVFEQPDGSHVLGEEYLSGDVVTKLEDAKAANKKGKFAANIAALEAVQPKPKTYDDIETGAVAINLGAAWVDTSDYEGFIASQLGVGKGEVSVRVGATSTMVRWAVTPTYRASAAASQHPLAVKYGGGVYTFIDMVTDALNLKLPQLGHYEGSGKDRHWVPEPEATLAARANLEEVRSAWAKYVFDTEGVRDRVLHIYNTRYNRTVERTFDGSHMTYPGMATLYNAKGEVLKFHKHQNDGVWRILASGNTLLAHEVGAGKTFEMIAAAMEMRRTGRARKPMIVVPTYLLPQWRRDILALYPNAKVAAFDEKDLEAKKRQTAMARIAYGDWDIVLVPHSSFGLLKVSEERMIAMMEQWTRELKSLLDQMGDNDPNSKQAERQKAKIEDKVRKLRDRVKERSKDEALVWEQLGVDALLIDEAHAFKNLFFYSKLENLRGLSRSESDRALDLFVKVQAINEQSNHRNLVLATATPLMNSMAEVYAMQRYLQPQTLRRYGFDNFDNWYAMFAHAGLATEQQPDGTYKEVRRLRDFSNLQLLSRMMREVMDYVGWEDMPYLKLPKIAGGKIEIVQTDAHPMYPRLREWFAQRMQNIKDTPPRWDYQNQEYIAPERPHPLTGLPTGRQDNILTIMNDAKKAAVDVRLILGDAAADFPGSRINVAAKKMATIYKREAKRKGVQLVFLDLGTPKDPGPLEFMRGVKVEDQTEGELKDEEDRIDEGDDVMADDDTGAFNLYDALKAALVARGVPANEIAYIHQASTSAERLALFQAANDGKVRFVFASTDKGGVGMNIQTRLAAIHELDAPRAGRPGDLRQRMGRGIRQGNTYPEVELVRYVTKGTTDEWLWGMLTTKDYQIRRFMKGEAMSMTEEDPSTMSLQEAQMRASGDPRTIELVELKGKLARLKAQAAAAERALAQAGADAQRSKHRIETVSKDLADTTAWLKTWSSKRGDGFAMEVGGKTYTKQKDADAALLAQAATVVEKQPDRSVKVGAIGGLDILASHSAYHVTDKDGMVRVHTVTLRLDGSAFGAGDIKAVVMEAPEGTEIGKGMRPSAGVVNAYEDIQKRPADLEARLQEARDTLARATRTLENPSTVIETAKDAARRIDALEGELKAEGIANENARREAKKAETEAKKDSGVTLQATAIPGASEFGEYVLEPAAKAVANAVRQDGKLLLSVFSPSHIGVAPYAADVIRAHNAAHDQRIARAGKLLEDVRKVMDGWARQEVIAFWDVMEGLEPVESLPRAHRQFVQLFKSLIDRWTKTLIDEGLIENYIEHYFPHEWAQPSKEGIALRNLFSRRPIQGRESFRKRRTIPTMREGLAMGFEPASWNPAVQMLRKITEMSKSLNARAMQKDLKKHGFEVYVPATKAKPEELEGWERVPEAALGTVYGPRVEEQTFGRVVAGHYYAPKEVVRLLTNYTSPGLYGRSVLMDAYKKLGNASTSLLLGWSSFHLWLIGIESMISKLSIAAEMLARGQVSAAAQKAMWVGPQGVIRDLIRGYKAVQEFYSHDADANDITGIVGRLIQGGGGFGWSNWEHEEAPKKFMTDIRKLVASVRRMEAGEAAKAGAKAGVHGALSLFELPTELIMNHWVPYLKVAAYLDMAEMELSALPADATLAQKRSVLSTAWDAVDDRFGQLRYANLFWDNTFKQILTGGFLSVGWQVGSLRAGFKAFGQIPRTGRWLKRKIEGGGGKGGSGGGKGPGAGSGAPEDGFDRAPNDHFLQREFAWMLSLVITVVLIDAIYQYLRTGKTLGQDDKGKFDLELAFRDAFYPRDGTKDASGRENRRAFISYMKDYFAWPMHPVTTLSHKLKPILHTLYDIVENEDFFGNAIVDEADPWMQRFIDRLTYAAESHEPIGWQNARDIAGSGASFKEMLKAWAVQQGTPFTPASAEWERSPVEQYLHDLMPPTHRSKEQAERAEVRRGVREKMQAGDVAGAQQAAREGGLSQQSLRATQRTVRLGALRQAFQRASWSQAVHAMEIAKPEERSLLTGQFLQKFGRAMQESSAAKRREVIEQRDRVMRLVRGKPDGTQS